MLGDVAAGLRGERFPDLPESFSNISLPDLVRLIAVLSRPLRRESNGLSQEDSVRESLKITENAFAAWPHGYHQYLDQVRSMHFEAIKYSLLGKSLLDREFPFVLRNLKYGHSGIRDTILDDLKEELANYVEQHVPHAIGARFTLTGKPSRWATLQKATRELGLSKYLVTRAQRENIIQTTTLSLRSRRRLFVDRDHLLWHANSTDTLSTKPAFKAKYNLISLVDAAKFLHVHKPVIKSLVQAGYIEALTRFGASWFESGSIEALLTRLENIAMHATDSESRWIELTRSSHVSTASITDAIEQAITGNVRLIKNGSDPRGLGSYLVNRDDLVRLFPLTPDGYIGVLEACRRHHLRRHYL
jgi:hypothetical protein